MWRPRSSLAVNVASLEFERNSKAVCIAVEQNLKVLIVVLFCFQFIAAVRLVQEWYDNDVISATRITQASSHNSE